MTCVIGTLVFNQANLERGLTNAYQIAILIHARPKHYNVQENFILDKTYIITQM